MEPKVSVILPTFDRAATLPRAMGSVLGQTFTDFELLVVDDGSGDDTARVVASFPDPRLRCIRRNRRGGPAAARNTGIAHARAALIAFQDSDDEWFPRKLEKQMASLAAAPASIGLIYCGLLFASGAAVRYLPRAAQRPGPAGDIRQAILRETIAQPAAWLVRRECFTRVGLFDETLPPLEDWEWLMRFASAFGASLLDEPLLKVHLSPDSLSRNHCKVAAAARAVIEKYRATLAPNSPTLARLREIAGVRACLDGDASGGRAMLWAGICGRPTEARLWGAWLLSLGGTAAMQWAWRIRKGPRLVDIRLYG